jgi:hypothetical protein
MDSTEIPVYGQQMQKLGSRGWAAQGAKMEILDKILLAGREWSFSGCAIAKSDSDWPREEGSVAVNRSLVPTRFRAILM